MNFYRFIIPRLNGNNIEKDFDYYLKLVKNGIAGFIIFGGRLETVRQGIRELQKEAKKPLIIASDLEQGLGGQIEGGTLFPQNPIISMRAFGEDPETVLFFGFEMIKIFQDNGIIACGKHSPVMVIQRLIHIINMSVINKDLRSLEKTEFISFRDAIKAGAKMIVLGISVSLYPFQKRPLNISETKGIIITDTLNMYALYPLLCIVGWKRRYL